MPVDTIDNSNIDAISRIFSTLNKTGIRLTPFELVVSILARDGCDPRKDRDEWSDLYVHYSNLDKDGDLLLQSILFMDNKLHAKSSLAKEISGINYKKYRIEVVKLMDEVGAFLTASCGIALDTSVSRLVDYPHTIVPMIKIWESLKNDSGKKIIVGAEKERIKKKFAIWWISAVLLRYYQQGTYQKHKEDISPFLKWFKEQDINFPSWLHKQPLHQGLLLNKKPSSAAGRLFLALLNQKKPKNPRDISPLGWSETLPVPAIHHIFPKKINKAMTGWEKLADVFLNTMIITQELNKSWLNASPKQQIEECISAQSETRIREIYSEQFINKEAFDILISGDVSIEVYEKFLKIRLMTFLDYLKDFGCNVNLTMDSSGEEDEEDESESSYDE